MENYFLSARDYTATLLTIAREGRSVATPEERKALLSFDGFGSIGAYLLSHDYPGSWSESEKPFHPVIDEIYSNITQFLQIQRGKSVSQESSDFIADCLNDIKLSSLTSYYTPGYITQPLTSFALDLIKEANPDKKEFSVLEPSAGTGRFVETVKILSAKKSINTKLYAIEPNPVSAATIGFLNSSDVFTGSLQDHNIFIGSENNRKYDLIISNIPFGDLKVYDGEFLKSCDSAKRISCDKIHNYFFTKCADKLSDNGFIAFITTSGFSTAAGNKPIREYLMRDYDLINNLLLPTNLFEHQNTPVQSSIVILQKPPVPKKGITDKTELDFIEGKDQTPFYFSETLNKKSKFGKPFLYYKHDDLPSLKDSLYEILRQNILTPIIVDNRPVQEQPLKQAADKPKQLDLFSALFESIASKGDIHQKDETKVKYTGIIKEYFFNNILLSDDKYFNGQPFKLVLDNYEYFAEKFICKQNETDPVSLLIQIRNSYKELIHQETELLIEAAEARSSLNRHYDSFFSRYGAINNNPWYTRHFKDAAVLKGLELPDAVNKKNFSKSEVFNNSLIRKESELPSGLSASEALYYSLDFKGYPDLKLMSEISGQAHHELTEALSDKIFMDASAFNKPSGGWEYAPKFLSGDIITKIKDCKTVLENPQSLGITNQHPLYNQLLKSMAALQEIKPVFIPFHDINIQLGNRWIELPLYDQFASSFFKTPISLSYYASSDFYKATVTGEYNSIIRENFSVTTKGRRNYDGLALLEIAMMDRVPDCTYSVEIGGKKYTMKDEEAFRSILMYSAQIKEAFIEFMHQLPEAEKSHLADRYNSIYNRTVKNIATGSYMRFPGLQHYELRETQKNSVAHIMALNGGIIDLPVGEGKTLVMVTAAHEMKRLGLSNKPMIIALKANVHDIAKDYKRAYPSDKVLFLTERQFNAKNRSQVFQMIANNNWDCIILSHEQFGFIPQCRQIQKRTLETDISALSKDINILSKDRSISKMELKGLIKRQQSLKSKLSYITDSIKKDPDSVDYRKMGITHLFVDESQQFKNLQYSTRHYNVAGLGNKDGSKKAYNLYIAIQTLQEINGSDLGATFLSGSTIKNSLVELYLLFKYMLPRKMEKLFCPSFDTWAANFALKSTEFEFNVNGQIKPKDRFRSYYNVPELSRIYSDITYYMNPKDSKLDKPGLHHIPVFLEPTEQQKEYSLKLISFAETGDPSILGLHHLSHENAKKARMAIACNYGKLMTLDMRIIDPARYTDEKDNKIGACAETVAKEYFESNTYQGTQFIFCDASTPKPGFNAYDELKKKLTEIYHIPASEIAFIHDGNTTAKKDAIITSFREGKTRILLGSTFKLGTGVNAQNRVVAVHHLDFPWTPEDLNQRNGRAGRFGNFVAKEFRNNQVKVYTYATKYTIDVFRAQTLETKQNFINQIKSGDTAMRKIDEPSLDENSAMQFGEFKAMLSGDDTLLKKSKLEFQIQNLQKERSIFVSNSYRNISVLESMKAGLEKNLNQLSLFEKDKNLLAVNELPEGIFLCEFGGKKFDKLKDLSYFMHGCFYELENNSTEAVYRPDIDKFSSGIISDGHHIAAGNYRGFGIYYDTILRKLYLQSPESGLKYYTADGRPSPNIDYTGRYFETTLQSVSRQVQRCEKEIAETQRNIPLLELSQTTSWPKQEKLDELINDLNTLNAFIENANKKNEESNKAQDSIIVPDEDETKDQNNNYDSEEADPDMLEEPFVSYNILDNPLNNTNHYLTLKPIIMELNNEAVFKAATESLKENGLFPHFEHYQNFSAMVDNLIANGHVSTPIIINDAAGNPQSYTVSLSVNDKGEVFSAYERTDNGIIEGLLQEQKEAGAGIDPDRNPLLDKDGNDFTDALFDHMDQQAAKSARQADFEEMKQTFDILGIEDEIRNEKLEEEYKQQAEEDQKEKADNRPDTETMDSFARFIIASENQHQLLSEFSHEKFSEVIKGYNHPVDSVNWEVLDLLHFHDASQMTAKFLDRDILTHPVFPLIASTLNDLNRTGHLEQINPESILLVMDNIKRYAENPSAKKPVMFLTSRDKSFTTIVDIGKSGFTHVARNTYPALNKLKITGQDYYKAGAKLSSMELQQAKALLEGKAVLNGDKWIQIAKEFETKKVSEGGKEFYKTSVKDEAVKMRYYPQKFYKIQDSLAGHKFTEAEKYQLEIAGHTTCELVSNKNPEKPVKYTAEISYNPAERKFNITPTQSENYKANNRENQVKGYQYSSADRIDAIKQIHMPAFLHHKFGYKVRGSRSFTVYTDTALGKIECFRDNKNKTGAWLFKDHSSGESGNLITFLGKHIGYGNTADKAVMQRIVNECLQYDPNLFAGQQRPEYYIPSEIKTTVRAADNKLVADLSHFGQISNEYLNTRGITPEVLHSEKYADTIVNKLFYPDPSKNFAFLNSGAIMTNENGDVVNISMKNKSTDPNGRSFSGFVAGANKSEGLATSSQDVLRVGEIKNLVIGESFIDNLSYSTLKPEMLKNTIDTSFEGRLAEAQVPVLQHLLDKHQPDNIIFITDKDKAGYSYDCTMLGMLNKNTDGIEQPKFWFDFRDSTNQAETHFEISAFGKQENQQFNDFAKSRLEAFCQEVSAINVNGKVMAPLNPEQPISFNEVTQSYEATFSFVRFHEQSPSHMEFQQKIYTACRDFFKEDFKNLNVVADKSKGNDWNQDLMNSKGITRGMIMANTNPFLGMGKEAAVNKARELKGNNISAGLEMGK